ncbi:YcnI family protein [Ectobacillus panaciterrae]|uniref:YcnI family copper-binding membrane protein n=1 Tax=Ectobacillus panaciterrae TaxID=363872 RepID=UPI000425665D|nr:DUF1775 domain-containing protein [Ectobacillus panaciterrae]
MKKLATMIIPTILAVVLFSVPASAHVTVKPNTSTTGAWETYTVKVPVEKDMPTTKVTLKMPAGVEFQQYEPVSGWTVSTEKNSDGKVTAVTWMTSGEGILPGQFQQFTFVAKNPSNTEKAAWDAYQYYKDGSIVEWTGGEGTDKPHSITTITTATSQQNISQDHSVKDTTKTAKENTGTQTTTMVVSILSLLLSIVALIMSLRRKK